MSDPTIHVFLGPSLPLATARDILDVTYAPPCAQGDVYALTQLPDKPTAILIIDGLFQSVPAVRHREILYALHLGIPVFGAASMGALRAADLSSCGMIGLGLIYRWYRATALAADDAVAVNHAPVELGSTAMSTALVDLRRSFAKAWRQGVIDGKTRRQLDQIASNLPYGERNLDAVLAATNINPNKINKAAITSCQVAQKQQDTKFALQYLSALKKSEQWPKTPEKVPFYTTDAWLDDLAASGFSSDKLPYCEKTHR